MYFSTAICSPPENGKNTKKVEQNEVYKVGDNYSYECEEYYKNEGENVSTCLPNHTWSLPPPTCEGKINVIINGTFVTELTLVYQI